MTTFCVEDTAAAGEPLLGTAPRADVWLLLEYDGPWAAKPVGPSTLPDAVKARLAAFEAAVPHARVQLVKRREPSRPRALFVASTDPVDPFVQSRPLSSYEEVADLDLEAAARGGVMAGARRRAGPLHLVCTHGKRDRCCAKWGMPVFTAMSELAPSDVWQATHVGGHRFAANVVSLPHGICYGRIEPGDARALLAAHDDRRFFDLSRVRGRSAWDAEAQAAEVLLRRELSDDRLGSIELVRVEARGGAARVVLAVDGREHAVELERHGLGATRATSCGDEPSEVVALRRRRA